MNAETTEQRGPHRRRGWRRRDSRGAALVEAAMLLPVLVLLTFGAIEYGLIYHDELRITTAARSGARIGVSDKNQSGTAVNGDDDWQILQAVQAALGSLGGKVVYVSIYNAGNNANGTPPPHCTGNGATSQTGLCNVYVPADFSMTSAQLAATTNYAAWPPSSRSVSLDTNSEPTYLGVEVETTHNYVSGLFGSSRTILERSVFRFEPTGNTTHCNCIPAQPGGASTTTTTAAPTTTTTTGGGGSTTTHAPTTSTTAASTTSTSHASTTSTTHAPTTTTTHAPTTTTTSGPTTTAAPTTTSTTSQIIVIPT